jgi:DNA-binding response OmpR family regulator
MKKILVLGKNEAILETVVRLISQHQGWEGLGASNVEEAEKVCAESTLDLIMLSNGLSDDEENHIRNFFAKNYSYVPVIQHYGGGSGLLENEIRAVFELNSPPLL